MSKNITIEGKKVKLDDRIITEFENFHKDSKSIYNEQNESLKSAFNIISVKNVEDVLRASDLFIKLNINILSNREKFLENCKSKPIENNFMIKDSSGWRIQSHYLGWGMNVDDLEKCVNYITRNSDIKDSSEYLKFRIKSRIDELKEGKRIYDMNEKILLNDKKIKGSYTENAHNFWKNSNLIISELEKLI